VDINKFLKPYLESVPRYKLASEIIMIDISDRVRNRRLADGFRREQLAAALEVPVDMIAKYESRNYNFTVEDLCRIAYMMDMDLEIELE